MAEKKFQNLKTHDCHVIMTQLLPVALRGLLQGPSNMFITVLARHQNEEVIKFCIDFIPDLKPIGVPESRHKGRLDGKGTLGGKK